MTEALPNMTKFHASQTRVITFLDKEVRVYSVGYVAAALNRSVDTLRKWEHNEVIPEPVFDRIANQRWYLMDEIKIYQDAIDHNGLHGGVDIKKFSQEVHLKVMELKKQLLEMVKKYEEDKAGGKIS